MTMNRMLPFVCPRGLSRVEAAAYVGVSVGMFDRLMAEGRMPKPICIGSRRLWDRIEVEAAFNALGEPSVDESNDWD